MEWATLIGICSWAVIGFLFVAARRGRRIREAEEERNIQVLDAFGMCLETHNDPLAIYDEELLPYPKTVIRYEICQRIQQSESEAEKGFLKAGDVSLASFQPRVGPTPLQPSINGVLGRKGMNADEIVEAMRHRDRSTEQRYAYFRKRVEVEQQECLKRTGR